MKNNFLAWTILAVSVTCFTCLRVPAAAQQVPQGIRDPFAPEDPAIRAARIKEAASRPTPRTPEGRPDLTGYWAQDRTTFGFDAVPIIKSPDGKTLIYAEPEAPELDARAQPRFKARVADRSRRPPYKPEFVAKQKELMHNGSHLDPGIHCYPLGVPRLGAPTQIFQVKDVVILLYADERDEDPTHTYRVVPIGGKHDPDRDPRPNGDSIAWWEGDTLVVEVVNIDPHTWLSGDGDFHSDALHVVERFTRKGNTLEYDVTIEDPKLFTGPWKPVAGRVGGPATRTGSTTRILTPAKYVIPDYACVEKDREHKVNNDRF
jgi:hypothetical protein